MSLYGCLHERVWLAHVINALSARACVCVQRPARGMVQFRTNTNVYEFQPAPARVGLSTTNAKLFHYS